MMQTLKLGGLAITLLFLAACVTINIYFPAAQAEQAAEKIVDDILGTRQEAPQQDTQDKTTPEKKSSLKPMLSGVMDFFIPPAHAAQPDFNVDSPRIRQLQAGMKKRHGSLARFYANGAIGFTNNAEVAIRDAKAIGIKDRAKVQNLLKAENRDRNALYRAIADANGHPEWEPDVRAVFARTWIKQASSGWWYQNGSGAWVQK